MSLPRFALEKKTVVFAIVTVAFLFGVFQFATMPRRADPSFTIRGCQVTTPWAGIDAERIERLVTAPLEAAIADLPEVERVTSTTTTGLSVIMVTARDELDPAAIPQVWDRVRAKVNNAASKLPDGVTPPVVNDDFGDTAILQLAVFDSGAMESDGAGRYSSADVRDFATLIRDRLAIEDGVARVELHGQRDEQILIETTPEEWAVSSVTIEELEQALAARSIKASGGTLETPDNRVAVQISGEFTLEDEIRQAVVRQSDSGTPITLADLGLTVRRTTKNPPQKIVRYGNAEASADAIVLSVVMQNGAKVTELGERLLRIVDAMQHVEQVLPPDIGVETVFDESGFVQDKISDFITNVVQAILIVIGIALLLAGVRSALVMAAAIPFVMLIAIGLSTFFDIQLEQMSIASLIISLGLLVDNAVVVTDNTRKFLDQGLTQKEATIRGVEQVMFPTLVGTMTTVFAFLPLAIMLTGSGKEYVFSIPVVVSITLLVSWLLAMTLTALMAYFIVRPVPKDASGSLLGWFAQRLKSITPGGLKKLFEVEQAYGWFVELALKNRVVVLIACVAMLVGVTFLPIGSEFFPEDERTYSYVDVWLPEGASLEATDRVVRDVESLICEVGAVDGAGNRVRRMYTTVGGSGPRFALGLNPTPNTPNFAQIVIETADKGQTEALVAAVRDAARREIQEARVIHKKLSLGPAVDAPIGIRLSSPGFVDPGFADIGSLREAADSIAEVLQTTEDVWDVHNTWGVIARQLVVEVDAVQASASAATNAGIAKTLRSYLNGHQLTTFRDGDDVIPVVFRLPNEEQASVIDPRRLFVEASRGKVPLDAIADVRLEAVPTRIERRDQRRMIEVRANVEDGVLANERLAFAKPQIDAIAAGLPPDISLEYGGTAEQSGDAQIEMLSALGLGLVLIIICLIVQYNGLIKPILVLATVPMGLVGALLAVYLSGNALGFMPLLGIVALTGIVVNSGILYLEFAETMVRERMAQGTDEPAIGQKSYEGLTRDAFAACLVNAGKLRLMPIILTAATTIGGLIPLALFGGPMWEGMAYLMMGGLAAATVLTLVVLPVLYSSAMSLIARKRRT